MGIPENDQSRQLSCIGIDDERIDADNTSAKRIASPALRLIGHVKIEAEKGTFNADEGEYNVTSGDLTLRLKLKN